MAEESSEAVAPIPETILVVDDEESLRALLRRVLEHKGYRVLAAEGAKQALDLARQLAPDLVLLDMVLPDGSGAEVCAALRRLPETALVPIIILSGQVEREGLLDALDRGADDFLRKPVALDELLARVASLLRARRSHTRFLDAFTLVDLPLLILAESGKVIELNRAAQSLLAEDRDRILGASLAGWIEPEGWARFCQALEKVHRGGPPRTLREFPIASSSGQGTYTAHLARLSAAEAEVLLTLRPTSENAHIEAELAQAKEFLESLITNSVGAIVAADRSGIIQIFNPAAERVSGYKAAEVIGRMSVVKLYAEAGARNVMRRLRQESYGGPGRLESSVSLIRSASGEEIPIMLSAWLLYDSQGRESASIGFFEDMRERVRIEQDLAQMREQTLERERQQAATAVAGAASHELNQPLTAILGSIQLLEQQFGPTAKWGRLLKRIRSETERMGKIVNDLGKIKELQTRRYAGRTAILDLEKGKKP